MTQESTAPLGEARSAIVLSATPAAQVLEDSTGEGHILIGASCEPSLKAGDKGWLVFCRADAGHGYWRFFPLIAERVVCNCGLPLDGSHDHTTCGEPQTIPNRVTAVTGLGRSGTTLMMWMLWSAGMKTFYDHGKRSSQESELAIMLPRHHGWLEACMGRAVKLLDPFQFTPPTAFAYDWILMTRNPLEQAASQLKLLRASFPKSISSDPHTLRKMANAVEDDTARTRSTIFKAYPDSRVLEVSFEKLIEDPRRELADVAIFLGRPFDVEKAVKCMIPRHAGCREDLAIEAMIIRSCEHANFPKE